MAELEIALLGGLRLRHPDRRPIELAGEKGPQLLARLACAPGVRHRRDTLQALLWPDSDPPHAQGNLRFVLHQLRKILGASEGPLRSDSRSVWLDPDRVTVDVVRFEALAAEGTLEALAKACGIRSISAPSTRSGSCRNGSACVRWPGPPSGTCSRSGCGAAR
jgi:DNA-binding SARP family transcriptional activator